MNLDFPTDIGKLLDKEQATLNAQFPAATFPNHAAKIAEVINEGRKKFGGKEFTVAELAALCSQIERLDSLNGVDNNLKKAIRESRKRLMVVITKMIGSNGLSIELLTEKFNAAVRTGWKKVTAMTPEGGHLDPNRTLDHLLKTYERGISKHCPSPIKLLSSLEPLINKYRIDGKYNELIEKSPAREEEGKFRKCYSLELDSAIRELAEKIPIHDVDIGALSLEKGITENGIRVRTKVPTAEFTKLLITATENLTEDMREIYGHNNTIMKDLRMQTEGMKHMFRDISLSYPETIDPTGYRAIKLLIEQLVEKCSQGWLHKRNANGRCVTFMKQRFNDVLQVSDHAVTTIERKYFEETIPREEVALEVERVLSNLENEGSKHFASKAADFRHFANLTRMFLLQATNEKMLPADLRTTLDLSCLEDRYHDWINSDQRHPPPTAMDQWSFEFLEREFEPILERFKIKLSPHLPAASGKGRITKAFIVDSIEKLRADMEKEAFLLKGRRSDPETKSDVSTDLGLAKGTVICKCPDPLTSLKDLEPLREFMALCEETAGTCTDYEKDLLKLLVTKISLLIKTLEDVLENTNGTKGISGEALCAILKNAVQKKAEELLQPEQLSTEPYTIILKEYMAGIRDACNAPTNKHFQFAHEIGRIMPITEETRKKLLAKYQDATDFIEAVNDTMINAAADVGIDRNFPKAESIAAADMRDEWEIQLKHILKTCIEHGCTATAQDDSLRSFAQKIEQFATESRKLELPSQLQTKEDFYKYLFGLQTLRDSSLVDPTNKEVPLLSAVDDAIRSLESNMRTMYALRESVDATFTPIIDDFEWKTMIKGMFAAPAQIIAGLPLETQSDPQMSSFLQAVGPFLRDVGTLAMSAPHTITTPGPFSTFLQKLTEIYKRTIVPTYPTLPTELADRLKQSHDAVFERLNGRLAKYQERFNAHKKEQEEKTPSLKRGGLWESFSKALDDSWERAGQHIIGSGMAGRSTTRHDISELKKLCEAVFKTHCPENVRTILDLEKTVNALKVDFKVAELVAPGDVRVAEKGAIEIHKAAMDAWLQPLHDKLIGPEKLSMHTGSTVKGVEETQTADTAETVTEAVRAVSLARQKFLQKYPDKDRHKKIRSEANIGFNALIKTFQEISLSYPKTLDTVGINAVVRVIRNAVEVRTKQQWFTSGHAGDLCSKNLSEAFLDIIHDLNKKASGPTVSAIDKDSACGRALSSWEEYFAELLADQDTEGQEFLREFEPVMRRIIEKCTPKNIKDAGELFLPMCVNAGAELRKWHGPRLDSIPVGSKKSDLFAHAGNFRFLLADNLELAKPNTLPGSDMRAALNEYSGLVKRYIENTPGLSEKLRQAFEGLFTAVNDLPIPQTIRSQKELEDVMAPLTAMRAPLLVLIHQQDRSAIDVSHLEARLSNFLSSITDYVPRFYDLPPDAPGSVSRHCVIDCWIEFYESMTQNDTELSESKIARELNVTMQQSINRHLPERVLDGAQLMITTVVTMGKDMRDFITRNSKNRMSQKEKGLFMGLSPYTMDLPEKTQIHRPNTIQGALFRRLLNDRNALLRNATTQFEEADHPPKAILDELRALAASTAAAPISNAIRSIQELSAIIDPLIAKIPLLIAKFADIPDSSMRSFVLSRLEDLAAISERYIVKYFDLPPTAEPTADEADIFGDALPEGPKTITLESVAKLIIDALIEACKKTDAPAAGGAPNEEFLNMEIFKNLAKTFATVSPDTLTKPDNLSMISGWVHGYFQSAACAPESSAPDAEKLRNHMQSETGKMFGDLIGKLAGRTFTGDAAVYLRKVQISEKKLSSDAVLESTVQTLEKCTQKFANNFKGRPGKKWVQFHEVIKEFASRQKIELKTFASSLADEEGFLNLQSLQSLVSFVETSFAHLVNWLATIHSNKTEIDQKMDTVFREKLHPTWKKLSLNIGEKLINSLTDVEECAESDDTDDKIYPLAVPHFPIDFSQPPIEPRDTEGEERANTLWKDYFHMVIDSYTQATHHGGADAQEGMARLRGMIDAAIENVSRSHARSPDIASTLLRAIQESMETMMLEDSNQELMANGFGKRVAEPFYTDIVAGTQKFFSKHPYKSPQHVAFESEVAQRVKAEEERRNWEQIQDTKLSEGWAHAKRACLTTIIEHAVKGVEKTTVKIDDQRSVHAVDHRQFALSWVPIIQKVVDDYIEDFAPKHPRQHLDAHEHLHALLGDMKGQVAYARICSSVQTALRQLKPAPSEQFFTEMRNGVPQFIASAEDAPIRAIEDIVRTDLLGGREGQLPLFDIERDIVERLCWNILVPGESADEQLVKKIEKFQELATECNRTCHAELPYRTADGLLEAVVDTARRIVAEYDERAKGNGHKNGGTNKGRELTSHIALLKETVQENAQWLAQWPKNKRGADDPLGYAQVKHWHETSELFVENYATYGREIGSFEEARLAAEDVALLRAKGVIIIEEDSTTPTGKKRPAAVRTNVNKVQAFLDEQQRRKRLLSGAQAGESGGVDPGIMQPIQGLWKLGAEINRLETELVSETDLSGEIAAMQLEVDDVQEQFDRAREAAQNLERVMEGNAEWVSKLPVKAAVLRKQLIYIHETLKDLQGRLQGEHGRAKDSHQTALQELQTLSKSGKSDTRALERLTNNVVEAEQKRERLDELLRKLPLKETIEHAQTLRELFDETVVPVLPIGAKLQTAASPGMILPTDPVDCVDTCGMTMKIIEDFMDRCGKEKDTMDASVPALARQEDAHRQLQERKQELERLQEANKGRDKKSKKLQDLRATLRDITDRLVSKAPRK